MKTVFGTTTHRLNLREGTGTEFAALKVLPKHARLEILEDMGDWLHVLYEDVMGYVAEGFVDIEENVPEPDLPGASYTPMGETKTRVNLRSGPGLEYPVIVSIPRGTQLGIYEDHGLWLNVMYGGRLAYVLEEFVYLPDKESGAERPIKIELAADSFVETGAVVKQSARIHLGPGEEYETVNVLAAGHEMLVLEDLGDWLSVLVDGVPAYIHEQDVTLCWKQIGFAATLLNMRAGPAMHYPVLTVLPENSRLEILEDLGDWLDVQYRGIRGFVGERFVRFEDLSEPLQEDSSATFVTPREITAAPDAEAQPLPRSPERVTGQTAEEEAWLVALLDNATRRYGAFLDEIAPQFGIEKAVAVAAVAVECGRRGFHLDGRMVLRFENHVFRHYWGQHHPEIFRQHFRLDADEPWKGHAFCPEPEGGIWIEQHLGDPTSEWQSYELAASLHLTAAQLSVSMGAPQVMGFNYRLLGYRSVQAMFDAFSQDEKAQLRGFFDLVHGGLNPSDGIGALRSKDFRAFAKYYNGEEKAERYAVLMQRAYAYLIGNE